MLHSGQEVGDWWRASGFLHKSALTNSQVQYLVQTREIQEESEFVFTTLPDPMFVAREKTTVSRVCTYHIRSQWIYWTSNRFFTNSPLTPRPPCPSLLNHTILFLIFRFLLFIFVFFPHPSRFELFGCD